MLRNSCFFAALFISLTGLGQKAPIKFGDVSQEILTKKKYDLDSSASAVILCDYGESSIEYNQATGDFELIFERTRRIKILTKDGMEWADVSIPLYSSGSNTEKLLGLKGITFNLENGKVVESKLKNDNTFREKYDNNVELVKATFPNVKEGSIIDVNYKVRSDFLFNFQDWEFQETVPVEWSEYRAEIPEYFYYKRYMQGYLSLTTNEQKEERKAITITSSSGMFSGGSRLSTDRFEYGVTKFRWVLQRAPAFHSEPFMTTHKDYISKLNFELESIQFPGRPIQPFTGTWEGINKLYAESDDFGGEVTGNGFLKKTVEELTVSATTLEQKVAAIYNYVKQNITWDGTTRKFTQKPLRQVLEQKKGNSAEINLLLASMLEKAGIDARPVLLSTRDHGFLREFTPASSQFNYVVCLARWEGKQILLDATEDFLPIGYLPSRCLNGKGLVISKGGVEWVKLEAPGKTRSVVSSDLTLNPDGQLSGQMNLEYHGYKGQEKRKEYFAKGEGEYVKSVIKNRPWEISKSSYENAKEFQQAFKEKHDVAINEHLTVAGDLMYMNPFVSNQWTENPFKREKREYPVDFGSAFDEVYMLKLKIPEGYAVDQVPASKAFALPSNAGRYTLSATVTGDVVSITSMLSVNRSIFSPEEYVNLREFYNQVVAKQSEQIVVKKK